MWNHPQHFFSPMNNRDGPTYVGDTFIVQLPRSEGREALFLNGMQARLMGFKPHFEYALPHIPRTQFLEPGVYSRLGDPVLKLETGRIIEIPMMFLEPIGYDYDDLIPKNQSYYEQLRQYKWVRELPYLKCNVGDTILIANQGRKRRSDILAQVCDVTICGDSVTFAVEHERGLTTVHPGDIIDVIEFGPYSEEHRYRQQMKTLKRILQVQNPGMKYADHENMENEPE
jgi:hypothetical protein